MLSDRLEEAQGRLYRTTIAGLLFLTLFVHLTTLVFEIRRYSHDFFRVVLDQVTNMVTVSAQTGDLISLQQNLESLTIPLSATLPVDVRISFAETKKLIVSARSESFSQSVFSTGTSSTVMANPFGGILVETRLDYSHLFMASAFKLLFSFGVLVVGLGLARRYVLRESRANLIPVDQFTSWLSGITPQDLRSGRVAPPVEVTDTRLQALFMEVNTLARELTRQEVERSLSELATQTAHDIRSPLSALKILSARAGAVSEECRDLFQTAIGRIENVAAKLLASHRQQISTAPGPSVCTVRDLLEDVLREKRAQMESRPEIQIEEDWSSCGHERLRLDAAEVQTVISNLLTNAVEAIAGKGNIRVAAREVDGRIQISISDNGRGMSPEVLARVGERGYTTKAEGSGLGLSHAKRIMNQIGGAMSVDSKVSRGTTVSLLFTKVPAASHVPN